MMHTLLFLSTWQKVGSNSSHFFYFFYLGGNWTSTFPSAEDRQILSFSIACNEGTLPKDDLTFLTTYFLRVTVVWNLRPIRILSSSGRTKLRLRKLTYILVVTYVLLFIRASVDYPWYLLVICPHWKRTCRSAVIALCTGLSTMRVRTSRVLTSRNDTV